MSDLRVRYCPSGILVVSCLCVCMPTLTDVLGKLNLNAMLSYNPRPYQIRRARQWHDRHSACFIPLAWAVSAAFAAKWECSGGDADSVTRGEDSDNSGSRGGRGKGKKKGGSGGKASVRRPSPSSVLALVAAFLDKVRI